MSDLAICSGVISNSNGVAICSGDWEIVPYVQPTDSTLIYQQLLALNEFNPLVMGMMLVWFLAMFTTAFYVGIVLKKMRQA